MKRGSEQAKPYLVRKHKRVFYATNFSLRILKVGILIPGDIPRRQNN